jgi:hypothetical protein
MGRIREELTAKARGQSIDLEPYFAASWERLRVLGGMIAGEVSRRQGNTPAREVAERAVGTLAQGVKLRLPGEHGFFTRNESVLRLVAERIAEGLITSTVGADRPVTAPVEIPAELRTEKERTEANVRAMTRLIAAVEKGVQPTDAEKRELRLYSGFGGLSIEKVKKRLPEAWWPEKRGLIHVRIPAKWTARSGGVGP